MITENGMWQAYRKEDKVYIATTSEYNTTMAIDGEFDSIEEKFVYAQEMAYRLNSWQVNNELREF